MARIKFTITIQQLRKEEFQMQLDADGAMNALDQARAMVEARNKTAPAGTVYSVIKVEE